MPLSNKRADQKQFANLIKVHWAGGKDLEKILSGQFSNKAELSAVMYKNQEEIPNKPSWGTGTVGVVLDGWTTIAGGRDLRSDNQKIDKSSANRSQQKYTVIPSNVETDVNKVRATKSELSGGWNEALVDNWKIKAIVLPNGVDQATLLMLQKYKFPLIDKRTNTIPQ